MPFDEATGAPYRVFDPCIWREEDGYYALSGVFKNGVRSVDCEGVDHLFHSTDLKNWDYVGELISSNYNTEPGEDYAVPHAGSQIVSPGCGAVSSTINWMM